MIQLAILLSALASPAQAAPLSVKEAEVLNKVREVTLSEVRLDAKPAVILADAKGISVYTFDADTAGHSNCKASCLKEWPTLTVAATETIPAPFGKIQGNDGRPQLTLNGLPLYYYADDKKPGDVFGNYPSWHPVTVVK